MLTGAYTRCAYPVRSGLLSRSPTPSLPHSGFQAVFWVDFRFQFSHLCACGIQQILVDGDTNPFLSPPSGSYATEMVCRGRGVGGGQGESRLSLRGSEHPSTEMGKWEGRSNLPAHGWSGRPVWRVLKREGKPQSPRLDLTHMEKPNIQ